MTTSSQENGIWAIDPLVDDRWPDLVGRHSSASVFHSRGWIAALQLTYGYEPIAFTTSPPTEPLTNALLFCKVRSWLTGKRLVSLPFSDHCEPLVEDRRQFRALCTHADWFREQQGLKYVEMRSADPSLDFASHFNRVTTYHLHRLSLLPPLDALQKSFHKDCIRRKIIRAERELLGYEAGRSNVLIQQLYSLLQMTRSRHHLPPQPIEWFQQLVACMGKDATIRIAYKSGLPIAGILTLDHGKNIVYKYGGSDVRFHSLGATPMLFWRTIQEAKQAGKEILDLGRSDIDNLGLVKFKERWAAAGTTLKIWRAPATIVSPASEPLKVRLAKELCSRLPDSMLALVGRLLYRHIG